MAALDAAAPIVARIKDPALRHRYAVNLDRWTGYLDERFVVDRVRRAARAVRGADEGVPLQTARRTDEASHDPVVQLERAALACALQFPDLVAAEFDVLGDNAFSVPSHHDLHTAIRAAGGLAGRDRHGFVPAVQGFVPAALASFVTELAVADLPVGEGELPRWSREVLTKVAEAEATRTVVDLTRQMARLDPARDAAAIREAGTALHSAQLRQRALRERALGA